MRIARDHHLFAAQSGADQPRHLRLRLVHIHLHPPPPPTPPPSLAKLAMPACGCNRPHPPGVPASRWARRSSPS
ncbi:MAG: hypothetical protein ACK56I_21030, partial [bacterium]